MTKEKAQFENLELIKEYKGMFMKGRYSLRVYRTSKLNKDNIKEYRYHFGYHSDFVKQFCPLLETTLYWTNQHWLETEDGYWLWWLPIIETTDEYPLEKLNKQNKFMREQFAECFYFLGRIK